MHYTLLLSIISWAATVTSALSISFSSGTSRISEPLNITWKHDENIPAPFFLEKIKLDESGGPEAPIPVSIADSTADVGISSIKFNRTGLFAVVAVNAHTNTIFSTEINVVSPTSSVTAPTSSSSQMEAKDTPTATSFRVAAVAGGVAGSITGLVLLSVTFLLCRRRNRHKKTSPQSPTYPFNDESASRSGNSAYGGSNVATIGRDGSTTEVSEQLPAYTSQV